MFRAPVRRAVKLVSSSSNHDVSWRALTGPSGRYLEFTLNRFLHLGERACAECKKSNRRHDIQRYCCLGPVGRYLEDDGQRGSWWLHDGLEDCVDCPLGRVASKPGSATCSACPNGTFVSEPGSITCSFIEPGHYTEDAGATPKICPAGRFSVGGSTSCEPCDVGAVQPNPGQASCKVRAFSITNMRSRESLAVVFTTGVSVSDDDDGRRKRSL